MCSQVHKKQNQEEEESLLLIILQNVQFKQTLTHQDNHS